eukprot:TRINITY_DN30207_c0_g1_i1.p1 TRINITY_DN30207_c0_g1~~TRINITY_DN30207_c0_g1_i1.p1  ORF type:complete len:418 (+),score=169.42 TRINITY_DN30207_c0_g1_i1:51-1304(+)
MADDEYFDFSVSEPVKVEGQGLKLAHWRYRVDTKTNAESYQKEEYGSYRRYNDFAWLRGRLREENPGCIVPPLPAKDMSENVDRLFGQGAQESTLHKFRQRALRKFLVRVGAHPVLVRSASLQDFIELDEDHFASMKKSCDDVPSVLDTGKAGKMKQRFEKVSNKLSSDVAIAVHGVKSKDSVAVDSTADAPADKRKWREVAKYMLQLEHQMRAMHRGFEKQGQLHKGLSNSSKECARMFEAVDAVESKQGLHGQWGDIGKCLTHQSQVYDEQSENDLTQLAESMHYYKGLCKAVLEVCKHIEDVWVLQTVLNSDLETAKKKRQKAGNAESQEGVDAKIKVLIARKEEVEKHFDHVTDQLTQDLARFSLEKQHDMKTLLLMNVELTREFAGKIGFIWSSMEAGGASGAGAGNGAADE